MIGFYNYTVLLTYLGLASSVSGIFVALSGHPLFAVWCLMFSGLCDMFDGKVARTRTKSNPEERRFGIQLDALSDIVCFGVLPCAIGFSIGMTSYLSIAVFITYILCALIRLAYFNITEEIRQDENVKRQTYDGLPVTSAAIILPLFYSLKIFFPERFFWLYGTLLFAIAICFISPFKLKKPGKLASTVILIVGVVEFALLIIQTLF